MVAGHIRLILPALYCCGWLTTISLGQNADSGVEPATADNPWWASETLTGDWGGIRSDLAERGIRFEPFLILDWSKNVGGGLNTQGEAWRHLLSLNATVSFPELLNWPTGELYVDFQQQHGANGSDEVGDIQYVGNWDADGLTQVGELWFSFELLDGALWIKLGKIDANYDFAYSELSWEFVHGSAGYPATAYPLPTYPDPACGMEIFVYPTERLYAGFGVFDGALQEGVRTGSRGPATLFGEPSDLFLIGEAGVILSLTGSALPGRVAAGVWHHTGSFDRFDGGSEDGTTGAYFTLDQMLWLESPVAEGENTLYDQGLGFYVQFDAADDEVIDIGYHLGVGLTWRGSIPQRDEDVIGAGVSSVWFSEAAGYTDDVETAVELFYRVVVVPAVSWQPYVQFISNPGGVGVKDAVNIGVRTVITF